MVVSVACLLVVVVFLNAFRNIVIALENTGLKHKEFLIDLAVPKTVQWWLIDRKLLETSVSHLYHGCEDHILFTVVWICYCR